MHLSYFFHQLTVWSCSNVADIWAIHCFSLVAGHWTVKKGNSSETRFIYLRDSWPSNNSVNQIMAPFVCLKQGRPRHFFLELYLILLSCCKFLNLTGDSNYKIYNMTICKVCIFCHPVNSTTWQFNPPPLQKKNSTAWIEYNRSGYNYIIII